MNYLYRIYNDANHLLYIGVTNNIDARLSSHKHEKDWWRLAHHVTIDPCSTDRGYAEREERAAIWQERPRFNIRGANWTITDEWWEENGYFCDLENEQRSWDQVERVAELAA